MADRNPKFKPMQPKRQHGGLLWKIIGVIIVLAIIYFVATWLLGVLSVTSISGPTAFTLTNSSTIFTLSGSEYSASFVSAVPSGVQISMTRLPTFLNPTYYVIVYTGSATKFNGAGSSANMQINLTSSTKTGAQIMITPLAANLGLAPDSSRITVAHTSLTPYGQQGAQSNATFTTIASTTTILQSGSSSSTTATTTIGSSTNYHAEAQAILQKNVYYALMANYTALYANESLCTPPIYNQTYNNLHGSYPSGPFSYQNVSQFIPTSLMLNLTNTTSSATATYTATTQISSFSGPALIISMTLVPPPGSVTSTTLTGVFQGANYTNLLSGLRQAQTVANHCGAYIG